MRRAAIAALLVAACSHPRPHPEGAPTPTGSATPVEAPVDAGAPVAVDAAPEASATPDAYPGTIGTGKYGVLGGGPSTYGRAGYGVGGGGGGMCGGGMGRRSSTVPSIKLGDVKPSDGLDKAVVRRYLKRNINKFMYCYEKDLLTNPGEQGVVTLSFTIKPEGTVDGAKADGINEAVAACVRDIAKDIEFPKPKDGKTVEVTVPFTFSPTSE